MVACVQRGAVLHKLLEYAKLLQQGDIVWPDANSGAIPGCDDGLFLEDNVIDVGEGECVGHCQPRNAATDNDDPKWAVARDGHLCSQLWIVLAVVCGRI